jgi:hypothetical protein
MNALNPTTMHITHSEVWARGDPGSAVAALTMPNKKTRESPGRKKPIRRPDSAKIIKAEIMSAHGPAEEIMNSGLIHCTM